MNVIFTCGGTAGHVNPALALAGFLRERDPKTRILFVGAERGLERDLIAHTPYPFRTVNISSFHRSLRPKELRHNLVSVRNLLHAQRAADAVKANQVDVVVVDQLPGSYIVDKNSGCEGAALYYAGSDGEAPSPTEESYAICVTKGNTELLDAINEVLAELGSDGIEKLVKQHMGIE